MGVQETVEGKVWCKQQNGSIYSKSNICSDINYINYKDQCWRRQNMAKTCGFARKFRGLRPHTTKQHVWHSSNTLCGFRAQNAWGQFPHLHSVIAYLGDNQSSHGAMAASHPLSRSHRVEGVHARAISDHLRNQHQQPPSSATKVDLIIENLECTVSYTLCMLFKWDVICVIRNHDY